MNRIMGLASQINLHLIKIAAMPNARDQTHWRSEVKGWFFDVADLSLKPVSRKLPASTIFQHLYLDRYEGSPQQIDVYLNRLRREYTIGKVDSMEVLERIRVCLTKVAEIASQPGVDDAALFAIVDHF